MRGQCVVIALLFLTLSACDEEKETSTAGNGGSTWSSSSVGGAGGSVAAVGGSGGNAATSSGQGGSELAGRLVVIANGTSAGIIGQHNGSLEWTVTSHNEPSNDPPAISMNLDGKATAALHRSGDDVLRVAHFDGSSWQDFVNLAPTITTRSTPSLAMSNTTTHLVFHGTNYKHYYARYEQRQWSPKDEAIAPQGSMQSFGPTPPRITVSDGTPVVSFGGDDKTVYVQTRSGSDWQNAEPIPNSQTLTAPVIVPLKGGSDWLAVYVHNQANDTNHTKVMWSLKSEGTWSEAAVVDPDVYTTESVALLALENGDALISYRGADKRGYSCRFSTTTTPKWSSAQAIASDGVLLDAAPSLSRGVGSAEAELATIINGSAVHIRYEQDTWTAPIAIGGTNLLQIAIASAP